MKQFLLPFVLSALSFAQVVYEAPCPSGMSPMPNGVTYNQVSNQYRAWLCVDSTGHVLVNSNALPVSALNFSAPYYLIATGAGVLWTTVGETNVPILSAGATNIPATATETPLLRIPTGAGASLNSQGTNWMGSGAANYRTMGTLHHLTIRARMNQSTNVRYWIGLGYTSVSPANGTSMATDNPNGFVAAFRFSSGTDTTIKAYCATDNTHFTVADTSIAPDTTNSQLFEVTYSNPNVSFFINGVQVAFITSNCPPPAQGIGVFLLVDNKNTANNQSIDGSRVMREDN